MSFSNSPLVSCTRLSPNHSGQRTHSIDRITPHCVVGQVTAESLGEIFASTSRQASCNYGIGRDGRVVLVVEEKNRSWCSSNVENDQRAVTIEVASDSTAPYAFREEAYNALIALCVDICRRNGKKKLLWLDDRDSTLAYQPATDEMVLTVHRWFAQKSCPGDWMYARMGELAARVTAALGGNTPASTPEATSALRQGDQGEAVKTMQIMLNACGFNCGEADGDFGPNSRAGLIAFQTVYGLSADGVYSEECKSALEAAYAALPTIMEVAQRIWNRLYAAIGNANGVAGTIGNFWKESNLRANNLQNSAERKLGMTDEEYTASVDNGSYTAFVTDKAGYGLYQATHEAIKESMLRFAREKGCSIGDTDMQVDHFIALMKTEFPSVWKTLTTAKSVREASDAVMLQFERPADQSEKAQEERAAFGEMFLKKYAKPTHAATDACYASAVIAVAIGELGYHEKRSNSSLDDKEANAGSNNFTKYARDFDERWPNWYNGKKQGFPWCDLALDHWFVSAYGYENALRLLCQPERSAGAGCTYSLRYYREKGQFHQYGPKPGDQIFFGTSLDNATHTGLVEKVDGSTVHTIEGNTGDQVARRHYSIYESAILGYGRPAYDEEPTTAPTPTSAAQEKVQYYRVRKSWPEKSSQIGAFTRLENAKLMVDANPGYAAFSEDGRQIYPPVDNAQ